MSVAPGRVWPPGEFVRLTEAQRTIIRRFYDDGVVPIAPIGPPLAAYLALLHTVGVEHDSDMPAVEVDSFTIWNAASSQLRGYLKREGESVVCPELQTRFPRAA
jgi:hypothetical protein